MVKKDGEGEAVAALDNFDRIDIIRVMVNVPPAADSQMYGSSLFWDSSDVFGYEVGRETELTNQGDVGRAESLHETLQKDMFGTTD